MYMVNLHFFFTRTIFSVRIREGLSNESKINGKVYIANPKPNETIKTNWHKRSFRASVEGNMASKGHTCRPDHGNFFNIS